MLKLSTLSPELSRFIIIASLFALANFCYMFFIQWAQQFFSGGLAVGAPLLLYILFNIVYAGLAIPSGVVSDRIGRKKVLTLGYALFALLALGFAYVSSTTGLIILFMLYGLVLAIVDGAQSAFISDMSRSQSRSTSLGIYYGSVGIASLISGGISGELGRAVGRRLPFSSIVAALAALALLHMKKIEPTA
jgi:MFS family permease